MLICNIYVGTVLAYWHSVVHSYINFCSFNVHGFHGSAVIHKCFDYYNLHISVYIWYNDLQLRFKNVKYKLCENLNAYDMLCGIWKNQISFANLMSIWKPCVFVFSAIDIATSNCCILIAVLANICSYSMQDWLIMYLHSYTCTAFLHVPIPFSQPYSISTSTCVLQV